MTSAELTFFEMAPGGDAVGRRDDGLIVFVPGGTPGDRALVELAAPKKGHARGRLLRVLAPGPDRTAPACPLAAPQDCGGCPLMSVSRAAELREKEAWVRRALRPSKLQVPVEIRPILAPTSDLGYRLRARLVVRDGQLGYAGARSHRGVAIASCKVLVPALDRVLFGRLARLTPLLGEGATVQGLFGQHAGQPAVMLYVRLFETARRGAVQSALGDLVQAGELAGVLLEDGRSREVLGAEVLELGSGSEWGPFFGAASGFAQPSAAGHELLPRLVAEAVLDFDQVLELYSGSGNLTRALIRAHRKVYCVEGEKEAAARARRLFGAQSAITIESRPAQAALAALCRAGARFDVVVLDPPRTGAREILPELTRLRPARIVYVSCDPMTLGRDLAELLAEREARLTVQPIDLMPRTAHVECVAVLDFCAR